MSRSVYIGPDIESIVPFKDRVLDKRRNCLTKSQYAILLLRAAGKSFQAVADELQIPIGTVKSRWSRGVAKVKRFEAEILLEESVGNAVIV